MTGIDPKPVYEIIAEFAAELGLDPCRDRAEVMKQLNVLRERWHRDGNLPNIFDNQKWCCQVECFPVECLSHCGCGDTYYGITLPEEVEGVIDAWEDLQPLHLNSRFYESRWGRITKEDRSPLNLTLMPEYFPTQRALRAPSQLKLIAGSYDGGKQGEIIFIDDEGKEKKWLFTLKADGVAKSPEDAHGIVKVTLPLDLRECVELRDEKNEVLAVYTGRDTVPCFRRAKVNGPCPSGKVLIQGRHKFRDLRYDYDTVEIGSRLILQHGARYIKYADVGTDGDERGRGAEEYAFMSKYIKDSWRHIQGGFNEEYGPMIRPGRIGINPKIGAASRSGITRRDNKRRKRIW